MAVTDYLSAHGVEKARLKPVGYNFSRPVAPNNTPEGRRQNRRVELHPIK